MLYLRASFSDKLNTDYSIFISFKYNPHYVELIKSLSNRCWNGTTKEWEVGYDCYSQLIGTLNAYNVPYNGPQFMQSIEQLQQTVNELQKIQQQEQKIDSSILDNVEFKTKPYSYQLDGIAYGLNHDRFLIADEMGSGKSLQTLNIARLKRGGNHCLIIVGYDALQFNWVDQIRQHSNEDAYVLGQKLNRKKRYVAGNVEERYKDLQRLNEIKEFFIITTVTTLRQTKVVNEYLDKRGKKKKEKEFYIANLIEEWCRKGEIGRIIFDEIQVCKTYDIDATTALLKLKSCPYKIAATGTPIMNQNLDVYPIMLWLGQEKRDYYSFRNHYCKMGGFKNKQVVGNKNTPELHARLSQFMIRRKKSDVLDLPEKILIDEKLEMDGKQWSLYNKIQKLTKAEMAQMKGNHVKLMASLLNLRKITCHPAWVEEGYKDSVKFDRVRQLVYEAAQNGKKTIIFSNFTTPFESPNNDLNLLYQLQMYNPALIIGSTKDRMAEVEKFQKDSSCMVIAGSIGAMGTGLTLNAAENVIFLDEPWNAALKNQAIDRAHRPGTKNNVNIYTLMCKDTIDESINKLVKKKGLLADQIVDGLTTQELEQILESTF